MFSLFHRRRNSTVAGIDFHADGVSLAALRCEPGQPPHFLGGQYYPGVGDENQQASLLKATSELQLRAAPGVCVLEPGAYSLLQVEAPGVEPSELASAIRWRVKDLLNFHIDDAVLDVYPLPEPKRAGASRMLSVVAARTELIQSRVDSIHKANISLTAIDVMELALRNLAALSAPPGRARALLYLAPRFGMIQITRDRVLYLSRQIGINARDLEQQAAFSGEIEENLLDSLVLEIQRSVDYYDSQFAEGGVESVAIVPVDEVATERLLLFAAANLTVPVSRFDIADSIAGLEQVALEQRVRLLPAIGAALRVL